MDDTIRNYFNSGYTYNEMRVLLSIEHRMEISLRHLKRHLKRLGLKRRGWDPIRVQTAMQAEIDTSGCNLGCRAMSKRLLNKHGLCVGRDAIIQYQHMLDPEGVARRSRNCLYRRVYTNMGPNFLIHIDGYDKIKRYGFAIHGAICGYSRRILWLRVARTNNDPKVIAGYFMQYVKGIEGAPRCVRMDAGTENGHVANMQKAMRWDHGDSCAGLKSVIIGSSHSNQRIEAWWRQLRRMCINYWMVTFAKMEEDHLFSTANGFEIECLRFCFMEIIQQELDTVMIEWNEHRVRGIGNGKPNMLYSHPELFGAKDYKMMLGESDIDALSEFCSYPEKSGCSEDTTNMFRNIMQDNQLRPPHSVQEATNLLATLKVALQ